MKNLYRLTFLAAVIVLLAASCSSEDDTTVTNTDYSKYIQGALTANADDFYVRGSTYFLTAGGITSPDESRISYRWRITAATTDTVWGQIVYYTFPNEVSTFSMSLVASSEKFYSTSTSKTGTLINSTFAETVEGITSGTTFTDVRDGQHYQYKRIGGLDWMVQNLNWAGAGKNYKNQDGYGIIYGRLYSWDEAKNACPDNWRLPTNADWEGLGAALNNGPAVPFISEWLNLGSYASTDATVNGNRLWPYDPNNGKQNTQGWNAIPAGKGTVGGNFSEINRAGYWWSATEYAPATTTAYYRYILSNNATFYFTYGDKAGLYLAVRCVKNAE